MSKASKKVGESKGQKKRRETQKSRQTGLIFLSIAVVVIIAVSAVVFFHPAHVSATSTNSTTAFTNLSNKPVILYVNQGNALVDRSNFSALLNFTKAQHFNTIFFQIYRSGQLLFNVDDLSYFVEVARLYNISFFFSLYITNSSEQIPNSILNLGENGINLDMSTLSSSAQSSMLSALQLDFTKGETAVTSTNLTTTLKPDLLVLETYNFDQDQSYIRPGIIASVEPLGISTAQEYRQELNYAISNSSGVMVFDYYGILKMGY